MRTPSFDAKILVEKVRSNGTFLFRLTKGLFTREAN